MLMGSFTFSELIGVSPKYCMNEVDDISVKDRPGAWAFDYLEKPLNCRNQNHW